MLLFDLIITLTVQVISEKTIDELLMNHICIIKVKIKTYNESHVLYIFKKKKLFNNHQPVIFSLKDIFNK